MDVLFYYHEIAPSMRAKKSTNVRTNVRPSKKKNLKIRKYIQLDRENKRANYNQNSLNLFFPFVVDDDDDKHH